MAATTGSILVLMKKNSTSRVLATAARHRERGRDGQQ